ncbi:MAG: glucose 1-dehydrogenase [SAR202 cluster bacterium]|jgi:3alpha(or 20beta)-hydroxysteroid dehydrogenase|nr:glucose 1-dehydrogenase [SAR202 cluster bacterium]MDP6713669.1 glucose 1-dehydrogenase [SAR202 cluster bacterium]
MRLRDQVALITGAASGMAAAQARLFASEGAAVCVADINEVGGRQVASEIIEGGGKAIFASLDVTDASQWAEVVSATEREFGSLTALCNNAGANFRVSFDDQTEEMWHTVMNIGLTGAFLGIKAAVPAMRRAGGGAIVNMGSLASTRSGGGSPAYGASKMGMVGLTQSAAKSYASDGIRCNMVSPGHVDTPFIRQNNAHSPNDWSTTIDNPDNYQRRLDATPLGRFQTPEDIAKAFLFLASDDASMITGVNLKVDGGAGM